VFTYNTYVKHGSARKVRKGFQHKSQDAAVPHNKHIHRNVNILRLKGFTPDIQTKKLPSSQWKETG